MRPLLKSEIITTLFKEPFEGQLKKKKKNRVWCFYYFYISINQYDGIYIAPKSSKVVQRRSRQLDETNFIHLWKRKLLRSFLKNVNSDSILDVVRESVPFHLERVLNV